MFKNKASLDFNVEKIGSNARHIFQYAYLISKTCFSKDISMSRIIFSRLYKNTQNQSTLLLYLRND